MNKYILSTIFFTALCVSIKSYPAALIDNMDTQDGWIPEHQYTTDTGTISVTQNRLIITRKSSVISSDIAVYKDYNVAIENNTWLHVFIRHPDGGILGGNMYTSIFLNRPMDSTNTQENKIIEFNVNGEEHWHSQNSKCTRKELDNSFHIGMAADNRDYISHEKSSLYWSNDIPVNFPIKNKYSNWILYSARYYVPEDNVPRWRFYVNGKEIIYRDTGYSAPEGFFQNIATIKPIDSNNIIRFRLAVLGDGALYTDQTSSSNLYAGAVHRNCYSNSSPFVFDENNRPIEKEASVEWGGIMIGKGETASFDLNTIKSYIYSGKLLTSAAIATNMISWQNAEFNCNYISHDEISFVRSNRSEALNFCRTRIINDIYAGNITTSNAILQNLIDWRSAEFNCQYMSDEEKNTIRTTTSLNAATFCMNN